jgi:type II secretory pathway pseudopilin PulG
MIKENRASKYMLYAIGEIVLVVIGILIALSINNWNEELKAQNKENVIVKSLYNEFIDNSKYIGERIQYLNTSYSNGGIKLLKLCNDNYTDVSADSLLTLIEYSFIGPAYSPKISTFTRIINNEEFNLIRLDSLKTLLNQYSSVLNFTFISNKFLMEDIEVLHTYSQDKFGGLSFGKKISEYQLSEQLFVEIKASEPTFNPEDIVIDPIFESILTKHLLNYGFALNRLKQLQKLDNTIQDYIENHYNLE